MNTCPIGLSTGCFYRRPILEILEPVRDAGFREIEVCSFPRHLDYHNQEQVRAAGERIRSLDLVAYSFHAPFAEHIDITSGDDAQRARAVAELITACEAAAAMGCRYIVLHPGPEREGRPPEHEMLRHMHHAADSLNQVAARCCSLGLRLLLENMLPHLLFGHVSDMMFLLGEINTCEVGACLDTGHAHLARELEKVIHKLSGHLQLVHVNDNHGDWDAHLPPGQGGIDWPWFVSELRRAGFAGGLILELSGGEHEEPATVLARASRARDYLLGLIQG